MIASRQQLHRQLIAIEKENTSRDKAALYQNKILQLLLRESYVESLWQEASGKIDKLEERLSFTEQRRRQLEEKVRELQRKEQNSEQELRLLSMGQHQMQEENDQLKTKVNEQEQALSLKEKELASALSNLKHLQEQKSLCEKQNQGLMERISQNKQENSNLIQTKMLIEQKYADLQQQKENLNHKTSQLKRDLQNIKFANNQANAKIEEQSIQLEEATLSLQRIRSEGIASAKASRQTQESIEVLQERVTELSKDNGSLKTKKSQLQQDLDTSESIRDELEAAKKKLEKQLRKSKEEVRQLQTKTNDLQEEVGLVNDKYRNSEKALKNAKRQIEQLKDTLSTSEQSQGHQSERTRKIEEQSKINKRKLAQQQETITRLTNELDKMKTDLRSHQLKNVDLSLQLEKAVKESQLRLEENVELQSKLIMQKETHEKAIAIVVKEKEVFSQANLKILSLLQLKDKALTALMEGKKPEPTQLEGDSMLSHALSGHERESLLNSRERGRWLGQWLGHDGR